MSTKLFLTVVAGLFLLVAVTSPPLVRPFFQRTPTVALPTSTSTATPAGTATPDPNCEDNLEPNNELGSGPVLISGQPVSDLTLRPKGDVDYFQLWVKADRYYQVDTATTAGVDTRLRIFNDAGELLAENDDFITGDPSSRMKFQAPADGRLFVSVDSVSPIDWGCRRYNISMVDVSAPTPTPLPLQAIVIDLTVYYDENDNDAPDVNEGITGVNLQILDSLTNQILGQAFTNNEGHATVFTSAADEVRLSVPYLGYSQEIRPPGSQLLIRIPPLHLPSIIP